MTRRVCADRHLGQCKAEIRWNWEGDKDGDEDEGCVVSGMCCGLVRAMDVFGTVLSLSSDQKPRVDCVVVHHQSSPRAKAGTRTRTNGGPWSRLGSVRWALHDTKAHASGPNNKAQ
jgi:hypothetical protein